MTWLFLRTVRPSLFISSFINMVVKLCLFLTLLYVYSHKYFNFFKLIINTYTVKHVLNGHPWLNIT